MFETNVTEKCETYEKRSKMKHLNKVAFVIFSIISWINCDICDVCMCSKDNCALRNDSSIGQCASQSNKHVFCDGNDVNSKTDGPKFNLNNIPWPKHNAKLTATFNHFKLSYLSK